jgi:hydroxypyruvate isomerase
MPYELSVNLEYMFHEAGERLEDRMAAAAAAGFRHVEIFTTANRDVPSLKAALADTGCQIFATVTDPRIQLVIADQHERFREMFAQAAEEAAELGARRIVVPSGSAVPYMKRPVQLETVAKAVDSVVKVAEDFGLTIILEPVNTRVDHPGVLFGMTEDAVAVIEAIGNPRVRLLYDLYHSITEREDPYEVLPKVAHLVEHIQVADAPGRGEPGSGQIDWQAMLNLFRSVGYAGLIGLECSPTGVPTPEKLTAFRTLCSAV